MDIGTTKMNTRSLIVGQNLAGNSQCFHKRPNQSTRMIRSGRYLKRENLFPGQREFSNLSGFQFDKAQKDNKQF